MCLWIINRYFCMFRFKWQRDQNISVVEYYKQQYNITLRYPICCIDNVFRLLVIQNCNVLSRKKLAVWWVIILSNCVEWPTISVYRAINKHRNRCRQWLRFVNWSIIKRRLGFAAVGCQAWCAIQGHYAQSRSTKSTSWRKTKRNSETAWNWNRQWANSGIIWNQIVMEYKFV